MLVSSVKWAAYSVTSYHSFAFTYTMNGFAHDVDFHFALVHGNEQHFFDTRRLGRNRVKMFNVRKLPAGGKFRVTMNVDVMKGRKLIDRYVYVFYLFVSPFGF